MKQRINRLILINFLSLLATLAFGQERIGVSGGMNLSNGVFQQLWTNNRAALGLHAKLFSNINLEKNKKVYIQPSLQYSMQGWSLNHIAKGSRIRLHYFNFSFLAAYKPFSKLSLLAGPQLGTLIKVNLQPENPANFPIGYRKVDLAGVVGTSYHLTNELGLELSYIHGLTRIAEGLLTDANANRIVVRDGYNRTWQVGISYLFSKK